MLISNADPRILVAFLALAGLPTLIFIFHDSISHHFSQLLVYYQDNRHSNTTYSNITESPHAALPNASDGSLTYGAMTSRPRILQTSMLFSRMDNNVSARCLQSHLEHGARHGYKMSVLRTEFMDVEEDEDDGDKKVKRNEFSPIIWDKPLYILSTLVAELSKPKDERAEWIV